jgi:DNA-binding MarR family transcriptional regulator
MTILQALSRAAEISQGRLGEMLAMDSTSLTRTLAIMRRHGWIAERRGRDRRERWLRLSGGGEKTLRRAEPLWEEVQSRLRRDLGAQDWDQLLQLTQRVTGTVRKGDSA